MSQKDSPFNRIIEQCVSAMEGTSPRGIENEPLGLYGITRRDVRLGNIVAIALTALRKGE